MEKQKRWQLLLIIAVFVLTVYNILPTVFYYTKPLKDPVDEARAKTVAHEIVARVNNLEDDSVAWLRSFTSHLGFKTESIELKSDDAQIVKVKFSDAQEAEFFRSILPKAGARIPFIPAQLNLDPSTPTGPDATTVYVQRHIGVKLNPADIDNLFLFSTKYDQNGDIAPLFREITNDRVKEVALAFGGPSKEASQLAVIADNPTDERYGDMIVSIAKEIVDTEKSLSQYRPITKRFYASFSQIDRPDSKELIQKYLARAKIKQSSLSGTIAGLSKQLNSQKDETGLIDANMEQDLSFLKNQNKALEDAIAIIEKNLPLFQAGTAPLTTESVLAALAKGANEKHDDHKQVLSLEGKDPFVESLVIDWANDKLILQFYGDVQAIRTSEAGTEAAAFSREKINQLIINDLARTSSMADESIIPSKDTFAVNMSTLTDAKSILTFNLAYLAKMESEKTQNLISSAWSPKHHDLNKENFPIRNFESYSKERSEDQKLGLVIYAPAMHKETAPKGFNNGSIYVIAKGLDSIMGKYKDAEGSPEAQQFIDDYTQLNTMLRQDGFIVYPGSSYGIDAAFKNDYIFELQDYYSNLLNASRENFVTKGSKRFSVLDFTDVEQRIITYNKIEDHIQEDLLKWKDEYNAAQVSLKQSERFLVPPPTKNAFWQNFLISFNKYFRGDDRKILKWGLDLSGGKTVRIGLRDHNNRPVTNPEDLKQAVNELYTRINKMGVSERTIRIENENIILDFPGSQGLSAADLIRASAMYFHIVNEKFSPSNTQLQNASNTFLQNVWNEAVVTNRKDVESINEIAWRHLGGDMGSNEIHPRTDVAKTLYENGLRLANPRDSSVSNAFDDTMSSVAVMRGDELSQWDGQSHPLLIVFHNYALEGSSLTDVHAGYDPSQGNILSFKVKNSYDSASGSPSSDFYAWTSQFAEDQIQGTAKENYSGKRGWRMAVILNGRVISNPSLKASLREGGTISGRFTQREVDQLAADLKAGSLSFTPRILSEQNVSPELGKEERSSGIIASLAALALVVAAMIGYYRFAGLVASVAVTFNIFIIWGVLQNLGAAITLPGIAGIILTIGMAVDANVLVFERFREEFRISGRIASAIQAAYSKAFTAIVDSNVTTIIAAVILLQFDSGPIKGFAVTLIIGIVSSMFTALFMTRYFFAGWVQNPKNKTLVMSDFVGNPNFNFLAHTRKAVLISMIVMMCGGFLFYSQKNTMFGMDFTGGYSLNVQLKEKAEMQTSYREAVTQALIAAGASSNNVNVRELSKPTQLRVQLGIGMEEPGQPFNGLPQTINNPNVTYQYEQQPRLDWVVDAIQKASLQIPESELAAMDKNWTAMSGQFSDAMRNNAFIALSLALLSILIYITLRFEFKYAIGAVVGLVYDVLITLGIIAFFHKMGYPIQINLEVIGAIMTLIGYSLNDTIIIFDRIREDLHMYRKKSLTEVINHSLNVTLSRTLMTSGTTFLVLITLVLFGGKSIFGFSLVMTIGVIVGTLSSLFIASPVMLYIHNREAAKEHPQKSISANEA